jgi:predicted lipid-binding transport protein (Tim44 family)
MKNPTKLIDELFSRRMLGSVLVGGAAGKMVEKTLNLISGGTADLLMLWTLAFVIFTVVFVFWNRIESEVDSVEDQVLGDE